MCCIIRETLKTFFFLEVAEEKFHPFWPVSSSRNRHGTTMNEKKGKDILATKKFKERERIQGMLFFKSSGIIIKNNKRKVKSCKIFKLVKGFLCESVRAVGVCLPFARLRQQRHRKSCFLTDVFLSHNITHDA